MSLEDNRNQPVFDETFLSNKGHYQNAEVNLLLQKEINDKLKLHASLGYNLLTQKLYLLQDPNNPTDERLNSYYKNNWNGMQGGISLNYKIEKCSITGKANVGYYKYYASANWNLIPDFQKPKSFEHKANGCKYGGSLQVGYSVNKHVEIMSSFSITYGASFAGKDDAYFTDGTIATTKFNGAVLKSRYAMLGLNLHF